MDPIRPSGLHELSICAEGDALAQWPTSTAAAAAAAAAAAKVGLFAAQNSPARPTSAASSTLLEICEINYLRGAIFHPVAAASACVSRR